MTSDNERQAEDIFAASLDLPTADRAAAVRKACNGNAGLLARVESFAAALDGAGGFMADATVDATADSQAAGLVSLAPIGEKPGDTIGRYKLLEKIGEGGFGVVFMAEQQKPVRRRVALKVIKLGMDTREVVARFEAERQALAMMDHPNIATVLDAGATDTGRPYFVMELVRGSPITEYADKHKLSTRDRVALATQVCRAIQHAHSKGVIHRDIKPNNVLVTVADDRPVPKVIDFGIAKATQSKLTDRTLFTAHRQLIGTPQYMSPEQADSDGVDVDTRTDVYSLGVLIYELLVGATPLDARSLRSAAFEAMRKMIRDTDVPRPATRLHTLAAEARSAIAANRGTDARRLDQQLHGELDWIVMKALEKDRSRRYDTAAALGDDLNRYLAGEAVLAGPVSGAYRLGKTLKRYRAAAIIGGVIAACLLLGVAGTSWGLVREAEQRRAAESARSEADRLRVLAEANAADAEGHLLLAQGHPELAQQQLGTVYAHRRETLGAANPQTLAALGEYVRVLVKGGNWTGALGNIHAVAVASRASGRQIPPELVTILSDQMGSHMSPPDVVAAQRELTYLFRETGGVDERRASALRMLGVSLLEVGDAAGAEVAYREALAVGRQVSGGKSPVEVATTLERLASLLISQGKVAEAEPLLDEDLQIAGALLPVSDPDRVAAVAGKAWCLRRRGRSTEADKLQANLIDGVGRLGLNDQEVIDGLFENARQLRLRGLIPMAVCIYEVLNSRLLLLSNWDGTNLAEEFVKVGETGAAHDIFKLLLATGKHLPRTYAEYGQICANLNDDAGYRWACERIASSTNLNKRDMAAVARARLALPSKDPGELDRVTAILSRTLRPQDGDLALIARSLLQYRSGNFQRSIDLAVDGYPKLSPSARTEADALLAMGLFRLSHGADARVHLSAMSSGLADLPRPGVVDFGDSAFDYLDTVTLASEAQRLVDPGGKLNVPGRPSMIAVLPMRETGADSAAPGQSVIAAMTTTELWGTGYQMLHAPGHRAQAEVYYRELVRRYRGDGEPKRDQLATALTDLGVSLTRDDPRACAEAESVLSEALRLRQQLFGPASDLTQATTEDLAQVLLRLGRTTDATRVRADADRPSTRPATRPATTWSTIGSSPTPAEVDLSDGSADLMRRGTAALNGGDRAAAEATFRQALQMRRAATPPNELDIAVATSGLGNALTYPGSPKLAEAETDLRKALAIRQRLSGPRSSLARRTAAVLAQLLDLTDRSTEAANLRADTASPRATPTTIPAKRP